MTQPFPSRTYVEAADTTSLYADPEVFPLLPGMNFVVSKSPTWSTGLKVAQSGAETRTANWAAPKWAFKVSFDVLRNRLSPADPGGVRTELQRMWAFFNTRKGRFGFFYYFDPEDPFVSGQPFGVGDGTTTTFQLSRILAFGDTTGQYAEPVQALWELPRVFQNGAEVTPGGSPSFGLNLGGTVTFSQPPPAGVVVSWTGRPLYLCRFDQDTLEFAQMCKRMWSGDGLTFTSTLG